MQPNANSKSIALVLLWFVLTTPLSAEPCPSPRTVELLAPGLRHYVLCRGEVAKAKSYRVLIGTFPRQSEADRALESLQEAGIPALPTADGDDYRVVSSNFADLAAAEDLRQQLLEQGFESSPRVEEIQQDLTNPKGPWRIHVLEADPKQLAVRVAHARDAAIGIETTTALALRHGAIAAINGGYYRMQGLFSGDSQGVLKISGTLLSEPDRGRAASGFFDDGEQTRSVFGRLALRAEIYLEDGKSLPLDGLNRARGRSEIILYSPEFHRTTLTDREGAEVVVRDSQVLEIRRKAGSSEIPFSGYVLSVGPDRVEEILPVLQVGQKISTTTKLLPLLPDPDHEWEKAEFILGGGPLLLWQGKRVDDHLAESISRVFFQARHPRTAVGKRADGTLLLITVDGRQPELSVGMSLPELTDLLLELGAVFAVNLDGGGSTTMTIRGQTVNIPSSAGKDRENGDALLLFQRPTHP